MHPAYGQDTAVNQFEDVFAALAAPFDRTEVKVRSLSGRQIHYITARTAMNRLDNVLGPRNWWDDFSPGEHSVLCRLTVRLPDGSLLTKCDAGGYAGMADSGDDDKSGYSDSFKRAAVKFGVARYLYRDGVPDFAANEFHGPDAAEAVPTPRAQPDAGPARPQPRTPRQPAPDRGDAYEGPDDRGGGNRDQGQSRGVPRTGKALYAWTMQAEKEYNVGMLKFLNQWGKLQEFPGRMVDWDADQVALAYAEASGKLAGMAPATNGGR